MPSHSNTEEPRAVNQRDEETPLLAERRGEPIGEYADRDGLGDLDDGTVVEQKGRWWFLWRLFWVLGVALVFFVFIRGWIGAGGDVDVSTFVPFFLTILLSGIYLACFGLALDLDLALALAYLCFSLI